MRYSLECVATHPSWVCGRLVCTAFLVHVSKDMEFFIVFVGRQCTYWCIYNRDCADAVACRMQIINLTLLGAMSCLAWLLNTPSTPCSQPLRSYYNTLFTTPCHSGILDFVLLALSHIHKHNRSKTASSVSVICQGILAHTLCCVGPLPAKPPTCHRDPEEASLRLMKV
jgi:hypothetical protein